jgi:hypothetical protein
MRARPAGVVVSPPVIVSASEAIHSVEKEWIASSRSLSSGADLRDPLAALRIRFAFVAGNDENTGGPQLPHRASSSEPRAADLRCVCACDGAPSS